MGCGTSRSVENIVINESPASKSNIQDANKDVDTKAETKDLTKPIKETVLTARSERVFSVGDRVHVSGYTGFVKFIGQLGDWSDGEWIGIELDHQHPQGNDGRFQGVYYFTCKPKHGLFARTSSVFPFSDSDETKKDVFISPQTIVFIQTSMRRYLANVRLKEFQKRTGIEKKIDAHVLSTPETETESVERLSRYLTSPWEGERNKGFAIFRWLSFHVAYDVDGFFGRTEKKGCDSGSVLKHRVSVCAGYANLFESLSKEAGLKVHTIGGYAKGYGFEPGQRFTATNHAWNALQVNGEWFICEPTWGAGFLGNDLTFHRSPNVAMFLLDPEFAICSHYPVDEKWQLLDQPITKEEFEKLVVPSERIHVLGVELRSHKESIYHIDADYIEMTFYSPSLKILRGELKDSTGKEIEGRKRTEVIPCGLNNVKLRADFPAPGQYKLCLYVRDTISNNKWHHGIEYVIHTTKGIGRDRGGFPQIGSEFYEMGFYLEHPLENIVSEDGKAFISLENYNSQICSVSGHLEIVGSKEKLKKEFDGFTFCHSEKTKSGYRVHVHCPLTGEYVVKIFAKHFEEGRSDTFVCTYFISALSAVGPIPGFPRMSDSFKAWRLELIEPHQNISVPDGRASLQIRAPEGVSLSGHLMQEKQHLDNGLCFSHEADGVWTILMHAPGPGEFQLNVFGKKSGSRKSEYMATYMIKSDKSAGPNPGFPYLKDEFQDWGLGLVDHSENIVSYDGHVIVTLSHPTNVSVVCYLFDAEDKQIGYALPAETTEMKTIFTCELPTPGRFKLNLFGSNSSVGTSKRVFLGSYKVLYERN